MNISFSKKPDIRLIAVSRSVTDDSFGPEQLSAYGALGCFDEKTPIEIYESIPIDKRPKREESVLRESAGRGHGSVADQNYFTFVIENLTRADTLQLCQPHYLAHLQQSLRRANADRGFFLPKEIRESGLFEKTKKVLSEAFSTYERLSEREIPKEDARYLLPLYTRTNIQTSGNARELSHLYYMTMSSNTPSSTKFVVNEMIEKAKEIAPNLFKDWGYNYETLAWYPSAQLFYNENKTVNEIIRKYDFPEKVILFEFDMSEEAIDRAIRERNEAELSNLKHIHNGSKMRGFMFPISLAGFHQSIRQRTWDHSVETIYDALKRRKIVVPPSVKKKGFEEEYVNQSEEMIDLYYELVQEGVPEKEAVGVVPHSLQVYDFIHVNGWNSIHSIGKRTCVEAQWEIRGIANQIAGIIREKNKYLGKYTYPQGVVYRKCPERNPCGLCEKILKARGEEFES